MITVFGKPFHSSNSLSKGILVVTNLVKFERLLKYVAMSSGESHPNLVDIVVTSDANGRERNAAFKCPNQPAQGNQSAVRSHSKEGQRSKSRDRSRSGDRKRHDDRGQPHENRRDRGNPRQTGAPYSKDPGHQRGRKNHHGGSSEYGNWQNPNHGGYPGTSSNSGWNYGGQYQRNANGQWSEDDYTFLSRTLSSILRHNAERFGFKLMKGGFLYVDEILHKVQKLHGFTLPDVKRVVDNNDKKRFALEQDENGNWKIRANQGHSLEVECLDLKPISTADDFSSVIHGTYYQAWEMIKTTGLRRMKRNHIHFAAGLPGSGGVISGMRSSCEVIIYINLEKALKDGLKFFVSANNVILSEGDKDGIIYPCYFQGAVDRKQKYLLKFDDKICSSVRSSEPETKNKNKRKSKKNEQHADENTENLDEYQLEIDGLVSTDNTPDSSVLDHHEDAADTSKQTVEETNASELTVDSTDAVATADVMEQTVEETDTNTEIVDNADAVVKGIGHSIEGMEATGAETKDNLDDSSSETDEDKPVEWSCPKFMNAKTSVELVENIIASVPSSVVVCCVGENLGKKDGCISAIVLLISPNIYIYHLSDDKDLVKDGKLDTLLLAKGITKVFFNINPVSQALIREYDVLMNGTPVWDIKLMYAKVTLAHMDKEILKDEYGFTTFKKWMKENEQSGKNLANPDIDEEALDLVIKQGKCIRKLYKLCSKKLDVNVRRPLKVEVYKAVEAVSDDLIEKVNELKAKNKKPKQANKDSENSRPQQQSKAQKQPVGNKGKKGKRK